MKKILLVDGNALIFRAYYASVAMGTFMSTKDGTPTSAVYPFINMLNSLLGAREYYDIKVAFDKGKKTFRHDKLPDYKAGRKQTPPDLVTQFALVREYLNAAGIDWYEFDYIEADDIIGTIAKIAEKEFEVEILSSDQDMYQLISKNTSIVTPKSGAKDIQIFNTESLFEKWGVTPEQVVDYKGLKGDSSDNLKGVAGIGDKTATQLIQEFGSIEGIYKNINSITGAKQKKLIEGEESAYLCKEIATIKRDVEINDLEFKQYTINTESYVEFLKKYEMFSILKKLNIEKPVEEKMEYKVIRKWEKHYEDEINYIFLETFSDNYHTTNVVGISIVNEKGNFFFDIDNATEVTLFNWQDDLKDANLQDFLLNTSVEFKTYDIKKTIYALEKIGYKVLPEQFTYDMMVACYVLDPNVKSIFEKHIYLIDSSIDLESVDDVFGKGAKKTTVIDNVVKETYIVKKSVLIQQLEQDIIKQLKDNEQFELYEKIELPFIFVLLEMEKNGVLINRDELKKQTEDILVKLEKIESEIKKSVKEFIDEDFNIASPKQLKELLFDKLQLKDYNKGSTDRETLDLLVDQHLIITPIIKYRKLSKLYSTYLKGFEKYITKENKVHTIFNQTLTNTGRLSSIEPNLQNISVRDEEQKNVRKIFVTDNSSEFMSYDYSQIELRVLADIANETNMIDIFASDGDIHKESARKIFDLDMDAEIDSDMRRTAKIFNFGIIYGLSDFGLAKDLKISITEAKEFIESYFRTFPNVLKFKTEVVEFARNNGYVLTQANRRRYINELKNPNKNIKMFGERIAVNMPVQGTAADILKVAMVDIFNEFKSLKIKSKLVAQIHDEIIVEVIRDEKKVVDSIIMNCMQNAYNNLFKIVNKNNTSKCKLLINKSCGKTWFDLK